MDLPTALQTLVALEGSSKTISEFEVIAIPGLLQTREYAEAILGLWLPNVHEPKCEETKPAETRDAKKAKAENCHSKNKTKQHECRKNSLALQESALRIQATICTVQPESFRQMPPERVELIGCR